MSEGMKADLSRSEKFKNALSALYVWFLRLFLAHLFMLLRYLLMIVPCIYACNLHMFAGHNVQPVIAYACLLHVSDVWAHFHPTSTGELPAAAPVTSLLFGGWA